MNYLILFVACIYFGAFLFWDTYFRWQFLNNSMIAHHIALATAAINLPFIPCNPSKVGIIMWVSFTFPFIGNTWTYVSIRYHNAANLEEKIQWAWW